MNAERNLQAEQDHAEWRGWAEAQGYAPDDDDHLAEAFTAGMQAARDLGDWFGVGDADAGTLPAEPQPAPSRAELETAMALALQDLIDEDEPQPAQPADDCAIAAVLADGMHDCTLTAGHGGEHDFADEVSAEPQPAPEPSAFWLKHLVTCNRLGHALAALREIAEPHDDEFPRDTARNALDDDAAIRDGVALTREPQPAPELPKPAVGVDPASAAYRIEAHAFNAVTSALAPDMFVPPSERQAIAQAVVAAVEQIIRADEREQQPQPAPGSAADELRAVIDMIWQMCQKPDGDRLAERITGLIKNSGMEPF